MPTTPVRRFSATRRARLFLALVLLLIVIVSPALAQSADPDLLQGFAPSGDFAVRVAGEEEPRAQVFFSAPAAAYLVMLPGLSDGVLVRPRHGVKSVPPLSLNQSRDGTIEVRGASTLRRLGEFRFMNNQILFSVDGREVALERKPPLVGNRKLEELLTHSPQYDQGATGYSPDQGIIAKLKAQEKDVRVRVFFGSWCGHCKHYLPYGIKVEKALSGSKIRFDYFGLETPPDGWRHPEVKSSQVEHLPTAIVYVDGRETGRFHGAEGFDQPEKSLIDALR